MYDISAVMYTGLQGSVTARFETGWKLLLQVLSILCRYVGCCLCDACVADAMAGIAESKTSVDYAGRGHM